MVGTLTTTSRTVPWSRANLGETLEVCGRERSPDGPLAAYRDDILVPRESVFRDMRV